MTTGGIVLFLLTPSTLVAHRIHRDEKSRTRASIESSPPGIGVPPLVRSTTSPWRSGRLIGGSWVLRTVRKFRRYQGRIWPQP